MIPDENKDSIYNPFADIITYPFADIITYPFADIITYPFTDIITNPFADIITYPFTDIITNPFADIITSSFADIITNPFADIVDKIFPDITKEHFELLAKGGWYGHPYMPLGLIENAAVDIKNGDYQSADSKMIEFFEDIYAEDKPRILVELQKRSSVLESAFHAHEHGNYMLSIPVFLIQVDGICYDAFKKQAYSGRHRKEILDIIKSRTAEKSITSSMLSSLFEDTPLTANEHKRTSDDYRSSSLNRHEVLHGLSLDYGTKVNSFKTISLLNYICYVYEVASSEQKKIAVETN